jgi:outer membrane receptor protein involved in Fe transport
MSKVKQLFSLLLFFAVMFSTQLTYSQTTASLNGKVSDQKGDALPGANIIAVHQPSGTQYGTTSREDGGYNLVGLRVGGPYKVTVSFVGYVSQVEEGFRLELSQDLRINFTLVEQAVQLSGITVTAEKSAVLSAGRTGAATSVSSKQIEEVPTLGRNFQSFAKLSPLFSGEGLSAAGRSNRFNNVQIDGTQYNDLFGLGSSGTPGGQTGTNPISLDAIREFQVVIAPYDVRQSGFTGGGINAITWSGTNKLSAAVYAYGRNESLVGKLESRPDVAEFSDYQFGFRVGGPIMKDKLFFFLNGEQTINDRPVRNLSLIDGFGGKTGAQLINEKVIPYANALKAKGMDAGSYEEFTREQPSTKLFLRFDYNLSQDHQLTLRHNFVDSYVDNMNARGAASTMSFDTYNYRIKNTTHSSVLQLNSRIGNNMSNELILGYTRIRDRRAGTATPSPEVEVRDGGFNMFAGPDRFSSANELDQDVIELTNNFSYYVGNHTFTIGTHNEFYSFRNMFVRSFHGYYQYNSLADFTADKVAFYQRVYGKKDPKIAPSAEFSVAQLGFYIQDEWAVTPQFKVTYGIRVDVPTFPEAPERNDSLTKYFKGYETDKAPSGNLLWSPRVGFNWDVSGDRTTQLRGGLGIFTGRVPYVWISNNYGNSGTLLAEVRNRTSGVVLPFIANPYNQYFAGDPRVTNNALGAPRVQSEINIADPNLKMPQIMRFNLGLDNELPMGFVGTVEFIYSKTVNDMLYRKVNINPQTGRIAQLGSGFDGRPVYGGTNSGNTNFFDILEIYNTSGGYQYNLAFQVQRNVARGLSVNAAYTFGEAKDKNSVTSSQAVSQMRFNPIDISANSPALTTSNYQIRHRVFASLSYSYEFFKNAATTVSLFYNGQTGRPHSFIVLGDLNNDGFDQNDLFYIPRNESEILLGSIVSNQFVRATANGTTYADLDRFIQGNKYLSENRGKIAERNAATNPWAEYFDLKISQDIPDFWGLGAFQVSLDVYNVANLINSDWGKQEFTSFDYQAVRLQGRITHEGRANTPVYSFTKPNNNSAYSLSDIASRWAMQFGIRYSF